MFDSLYNIIYNAFFANSTAISSTLAIEISSWLATAGCVAIAVLPFLGVIGIIKLVLRIGR